jgi:ATP-dependent DNA helicase PIF1
VLLENCDRTFYVMACAGRSTAVEGLTVSSDQPTPCQRKAIDAALQGKSILVSGVSSAGKSVCGAIILAALTESGKAVDRVSTTGARNDIDRSMSDARTLSDLLSVSHNELLWLSTESLVDRLTATGAKDGAIVGRLKSLDALIIEESQELTGRTLKKIELVLEAIRGSSLQLILIGDFHRMAPSGTRTEDIGYYLFHEASFYDIIVEKHELQSSELASTGNTGFMHRLARQELTEADFARLKACIHAPAPTDGIGPVRLCSTPQDAQSRNVQALRVLGPGAPMRYPVMKLSERGSWQRQQKLLDALQRRYDIPHEFTTRVGGQVIAGYPLAEGVTYGTQGVVLAATKDNVTVRFLTSTSSDPAGACEYKEVVVPFVTRSITDEECGKLSLSYLPLLPGWAQCLSKVQYLRFDRVELRLDTTPCGLCAFGAAYTAITTVKSLEGGGLKLVAFHPHAIRAHPAVNDFCDGSLDKMEEVVRDTIMPSSLPEDDDGVNAAADATAALEGMSASQRTALFAALEGSSLVLSGPGGCGKSFWVRTFVELMDCGGGGGGGGDEAVVEVCALTGIAAINANGKTVHSLLRVLPSDVDGTDGSFKEIAEGVIARVGTDHLVKIKTLIVDEASMMTIRLFLLADWLFRLARCEEGLPFGGISVILVGDWFQLPPVIGKDAEDFRLLFQCHEFYDLFSYRFELTESFRQKDKSFFEFLCRVRRAQLTVDDRNFLFSKVVPAGATSVLCLYGKNEAVRSCNKTEHAKLTGKPLSFRIYDIERIDKQVNESEDQAQWTKAESQMAGMLKKLKKEFCLDENGEATEMVFKKGEKLLLRQNLDIKGGLANGTRCTLVDWMEYKGEGLGERKPDSAEELKLTSDELGKYKLCPAGVKLPVVKLDNPKEGEEEKLHLIPLVYRGMKRPRIAQVGIWYTPLTAAYSCTVHKAQGMSLDGVHADLSRSQVFEYGQAYVSLSRVRNPNGLTLQGFSPSSIQAHPDVAQFYDTPFDKCREVCVRPEKYKPPSFKHPYQPLPSASSSASSARPLRLLQVPLVQLALLRPLE